MFSLEHSLRASFYNLLPRLFRRFIIWVGLRFQVDLCSFVVLLIVICFLSAASGLDSTHALLVVKCMLNIARGGNGEVLADEQKLPPVEQGAGPSADQASPPTHCPTRGGVTVISSIHQPSSQIFELFDDLLLLDEGRTVYFGPCSDAVAYFGGLGFVCPATWNPSCVHTNVKTSKHQNMRSCHDVAITLFAFACAFPRAVLVFADRGPSRTAACDFLWLQRLFHGSHGSG